MHTYKALAALLSYPSETLQQAVAQGEIQNVLKGEGLLTRSLFDRLNVLCKELAEGDLLDLQERYVDLFDRSRSRSLHLFEHVHGESRDRGQAMVDLGTMYSQAGLEIAAKELPDYLPLYLEYLSVLEPDEAQRRLAQPIHVVAAIGARLNNRESPYAAIFDAMEALAAEKADRAALDTMLSEEDDDPNDTERLDATWAEEPVSFGPTAPGTGGNDCGRIKQIAERIASVKDRTSAEHRSQGKT